MILSLTLSALAATAAALPLALPPAQLQAQVGLQPEVAPPAYARGGNLLGETWIVAGQSQMLGVNYDRDATPAGLDRLPPNVLMLDGSNQIVPWQLPFETPHGALQGTHENVSPAISFLKTRAELFPDRLFLLVFAVRGASGFSVQVKPEQNWAVPGSSYYMPGNMSDILEDRIRRVRKLGWEPTGVLWLQGESDVLVGPAVYSVEFNAFRDRVRQLSDKPELPFYLGGIARFEWKIFTGGHLIDQALQNLASSDSRSWYVTTEDMQPQNDNLHFDTPSVRMLGKRFASFVQSTLGQDIAEPVYFNPSPVEVTNKTNRDILVQFITPGGSGIYPSYSAVAELLDRFESFRQQDGSLHLELTWSNGESVRWRQDSNPFAVSRDVVNGFTYLPDSPVFYAPGKFGGLCRTAASSLVLSVQPGQADAYTSGVGLFLTGSVEKLVGLGAKDMLWTPAGVLVDGVRLTAL